MRVVSKVFLLCLASLISLTGCAKAPELTTAAVPKPVQVQAAKVATKTTYLTYVGTVQSETVKKLSFAVGGRLASVSAEKGDNVKKGQLLAALETHQYQIGVDASGAQVEAARAVFEKAEKAEAYLKDQLAKSKKLLAEGAISQSTYDELSLQYEAAMKDAASAKAQLSQAGSGLSQSASAMDDTKLTADLSGKVMDVLYKKGEIVAPGYPVVIIQNDDQIFSFGVSQKDYQAMKIGSTVTVTVDGQSAEGKLMSLSDVPDQTTRTYEAKVMLLGAQFPLGAVGEVQIPNGQTKGVEVPLNVILSGEYDFVFVVENGKAVKKKVEILDVQGNHAIVKGIADQEQIVISGVKNIDSADDVHIE